jgi:NADH-quinone oxidoreductase subunit H
MFITFLIYFTASLAEVNRTPFDIPEAESELVAGYHTEYTGMKFAMFYLAEYANMFLVSGISAILFFGGWNSPFGDFMSGPAWGVFWFVLKGLLFVFLQIMLRWTLPRLRVDQLMYVSWKVLTPISFVNILIVGLWALLK